MSASVTLVGVPTEDVELGYVLQSGYHSHGVQWQVSDDGTTWTTVAYTETFTPGDAESGKSLRVVVDAASDFDETPASAVSGVETVLNVNDLPQGDVTIIGTAEQGETLFTVDTVADDDGMQNAAFSYQWQVESSPGIWTEIAGATDFFFNLTQAEVGHSVRAVLSYTDDLGTTETVESDPTLAVENIDDEPGGTLAVVGTARQGQVLSLADAVTDADGISDPGRGYEWQVADGSGGWTSIPGATGAAFALTQAEVGRQVRMLMSYQDDHGNREWVASAPTLPVENANDGPGGALSIVGVARQGEVLSLTDAVTDADGMQNAVREYQWQVRDGAGDWTDIAGATAATFTLTQAEVGRSVRAVLAYQDDRGQWETPATDGTPPIENANDAPSGAPVLNAGSGHAPVEDVPVTVDVAGVADADGLGAFAYIWSREGAAGTWAVIDGADGASYTPADGDVGGRLKVEASYTDGGGAVERLTLVTASAVANVNDAPTGAVTLAGQAVRGGTITASTSPLADVDGMGVVSLRWERADGDAWTPIAGATAAAYTFGQADVGHVLRAVATWTDGHGTAERAVAETGVVAARAIALPPPEGGENERDAAADEWTSADLGAMIAGGDVFAPPAGVESVELADGVLSFGTGTAEALVARLYLGLLGREGDVEGLAFAREALENGVSRADLARMFVSSGEFEARHGARTDAEFVEDLYTAFLGRPGGASEHGFWTAALDGGVSRAEIAAGIAGSDEAGNHMRASTTGVFVADLEGIQARSLYKCALGREADAPGLRHWSNLLEQGIDPRTLGGFFEQSSEFQARHGASSDEAFVGSLYQSGAGRPADAAGLDYWVGLLESGQMGRGEVALHFAMTQEARNDLDWAL